MNQLILGDNLEVLKSLESESIDLIYLDPPFFSDRNYELILYYSLMSKKFSSYNKYNKLEVIKPKRYSGSSIDLRSYPFYKSNHFIILRDMILDGAAPKEVIKLYTYQKGKRTIDKKKRWSIYIVKTGHKNYPMESITEQMFSDIGKCLPLNMAETFLGVFSNQLKIGSKYFLKRNEKLVKGVEIYGEILEDKNFIEEIEAENLAQELITVKFTWESLKHKYKDYHQIFNDYIKLLLFDGLIGNNDRHFYNWGVIESQKRQKRKVYKFSPIYDTARGMFWNITESRLTQYLQESKMEKYIETCQAKTSYSGKKENHFQLIENIWKNRQAFRIDVALFKSLINKDNLYAINKMLDAKYKDMLSNLRFQLVKKCLQKRFAKMIKIIEL